MAYPAKIFIVPYRDRARDKELFLKQIKILLADDTEPYEIYFSHQCDKRHFNRGAVKNIGFLAMKQKYPSAYTDITFVFHDVDTWPCKKGLLDYNTSKGVVKHFYGYNFALGGMFSIKGGDFEKSKGFPNFWGWGLEDNKLNDRCLEAGLTIDRSVFYHIRDPRIVRTFDGFYRTISKRDGIVYKHETPDDMNALTQLKWHLQNEFIQILSFECSMKHDEQTYAPLNISINSRIPVPKAQLYRRSWKMFSSLKV
jgi:hypothetical protein